MSRPVAPLASPLRRILAAFCAALVLALTLFAASPGAHDWLHAAEKQHTCSQHADSAPVAKSTPAPAAADHECAVVLYASGVDLPVGPIALLPPRLAPQGVSPVTAAEVFLVSPRYLRQPERGPPVS